MLIEALVLDGHGGVDQILGDILKVRPLPVVFREDVLQLLNVALLVQIIDIGVQIAAGFFPVCGQVGEDLLLHIIAHGAGQHHKTDADDDEYGAQGAYRNFKNTEG